MFVENPEFEGKASAKFRAEMVDHPLVTPQRSFEEYKDRYANNWLLNRTDDGILTAKWHTGGGDLEYNLGFHRSVGQLLEDIGQDADTEVLIIGGHGDTYLKKFKSLLDEDANMSWYAYEHMFYDGTRMINALVNSLRIPTIGIINGDAYHAEIAVMCDLTLMADDAVIGDPHFVMGGIPGDGIQIALRNSIGVKRANYAMMMFDQIDAQKALEFGLVNEILPRDELYARASEIAAFFMTKPRLIRRLTSEIMKHPWQKALAEELRPHFGMEMWSFFGNPGLNHETGFKAIADWRAMYERKGRGDPETSSGH
jgi:enoyl-CoA hydratase/carnithine racemase